MTCPPDPPPPHPRYAGMAARDHVHIDVRRDEDVRYWSQRLAVDAQTLRDAVAAVGPLAYAVERHLEAHGRSATHGPAPGSDAGA